jgi:hypothetical protein
MPGELGCNGKLGSLTVISEDRWRGRNNTPVVAVVQGIWSRVTTGPASKQIECHFEGPRHGLRWRHRVTEGWMAKLERKQQKRTMKSINRAIGRCYPEFDTAPVQSEEQDHARIGQQQGGKSGYALRAPESIGYADPRHDRCSSPRDPSWIVTPLRHPRLIRPPTLSHPSPQKPCD